MPAAESGRPPSSLEGWRRDAVTRFRFGQRRFDPASGTIELAYAVGDIPMVERFKLPSAAAAACPGALEPALDLLHWTAGISYWKTACPSTIQFDGHRPDDWQAAWLAQLYREGLAEFAWRNELAQERWALFPAGGSPASAGRCALPRRALVPMGGGKDSLVALERVRAVGEPLATVQVGRAELIRQVAEVANTSHFVVERHVDPRLAELNRLGAWNGHVPITAINAAVLVVLAVVHGFDRVVFANERSADEATLHDEFGRPVNHQFSKSLAFERMLGEWLARYVTPDLAVFSMLRRDRELSVCREFAGLDRYHDVFSSCNRNFHLDGARTDRWCGSCPKCHFVFLALAPFMTPEALVGIFGANLLDDESQLEGFRALLALAGARPFECVGEADEARAALAILAGDARWRDCRIVAGLAPLLNGLDVPDIDALCRPSENHRIPDDLLADA